MDVENCSANYASQIGSIKTLHLNVPTDVQVRSQPFSVRLSSGCTVI
jgi:hypothetical protein